MHQGTWLERLRKDLPGMATSVIVHGIIFFSLTFVAIPAKEREKIFSTLISSGEGEGEGTGGDDKNAAMLDAPIGVASATSTVVPETIGTPIPIATAPAQLDAPPAFNPNPLNVNDFRSGGGDDSPGTGTGAAGTGTGKPGGGSGGSKFGSGDYGGRGSSGARGDLVKAYGGTPGSESAVDAGLKWLARQQRQDGSWSFHHGPDNPGALKNCENGATAFALLAFLGRGYTHKSKNKKENPYTENVRRGLDFLIYNAKSTPNGADLRASSGEGSMYVQGIATLALCEAYALSKDKQKLMIPATEAARFIVNAQDPRGGGWGYGPGSAGDTSVVGWQLMALKAAQNSGIKIPPSVWGKANQFLTFVSSAEGSQYGYNAPGGTPTLTSVGLLCRMYMGWTPKVPALEKGVVYLSKTGPGGDMYYNYYATQVLHHWGGEPWVKWNNVMREALVAKQIKQGDAMGSWTPFSPHLGGQGGRLLETCVCIMTLEVYYRHLPLYKRELFTEGNKDDGGEKADKGKKKK